ncbi:MAG: hypothetical protein MK105_18005 [Crocinitomicaceae bacterium]|nr:hypothetical protein [Crocinitomicaceae bacterium]
MVPEKVNLTLYGSGKKIKFINCVFKELSVKGTVEYYFNDCEFEKIYSDSEYLRLQNPKVSSLLNIQNQGIAIVRDGTVRVLNVRFDRREISNLRFYETKIEEATITGSDYNKDDGNNLNFEGVEFGYLLLVFLKVHQNTRINFISCTVIHEYSLHNSDLGKLEFNSCDFSQAVHVVSSLHCENATYGNIKWFKKIYHPSDSIKDNLWEKVFSSNYLDSKPLFFRFFGLNSEDQV